MSFLLIFRIFPTTFRRFPKIVSQARRTFPNIFRTVSKYYRRLPKTTEEDPQMFQSHTNKLKGQMLKGQMRNVIKHDHV